MGDRFIKKRVEQMAMGEPWLAWSPNDERVDQNPVIWGKQRGTWPPPWRVGGYERMIVDTQDEWHLEHVLGAPVAGPNLSHHESLRRLASGPSDAEVVAALRAYWRLLDGLQPDDGHPVSYVDSEQGLSWSHPTLGFVTVPMAEASAAWSRELRRLTDESEAARRPMEIERQPAVPEDL